MYFKSLELIGFKSFAEKTKLNFEPGVTAIVGPNGCGKSNIADSVRWVLGEQSAKSLRASKMEDVIFNGTDSKDPINFAEVSLTFDNQKRLLPIDYDEVTISRRCFRSGENEYLLNKTPVRLKDINELLMGTGIGTESYSIIEQGKMDLILSSKPEDRRYVFEEASGITKFKAKKKEAMRKLEQTEQNLLRIGDIIQEVKRQIGSIERQAKKAEKYKVDFDSLKELEIKFSFFEFRSLKTDEKTFLAEGEALKEREKELDEEIRSIASSISNFRQSLDEVNLKISELKTRQNAISSTIEMNLHRIEIDKERIEEARLTQEALTKEIGSINDKVAASRKLAERLRDALSKVEGERQAKYKLVEEKEAFWTNLSSEIEQTEEKVKSSKVQIVDFLAKETRIKNELIKLGADVQNRNARKRRLSIEKETVEKELESVERARDAVAKDYEELEAKVSTLRSGLEDKKDQDKTIYAEIQALESSIAEKEKEKAALSSKIEFLEDLVKKYEGFNQGVKTILLGRGTDGTEFGGVRGVLADIIRIERGYEEAVNAFLGDDAQVIITERDSDITNAIDYLKQNRSGRANFVSMETLGRIDQGSAQDAAPDGMAPLRKFVRSDSAYAKVLDHIFSGAYLAEGADSASISYLSGGGRYTVVTKTGVKFQRGRISGGSVVETEETLLIGRRDRLESFKASLEVINGGIEVLHSHAAEKIQTAETLKTEIEALEHNLHSEDINLANIKNRKDAQEENAKKLREELSVADLELDEVNQTIEDLTKNGEELNLELNNIEKESSSLQHFIEEAQGSIGTKRDERERVGLEIATLRTEAQSIDRDEDNARNNLQKEEAMLFELEESLLTKEGLLKESHEKVGSFEREIVKLTASNESLQTDLDSLNDEMSTIDAAKSSLTEKLASDEVQQKDKDNELESLRNQVRDFDVRLTELVYKKTNLKDRIQQAYKIDIDTVHMELEENIDWEAIKIQVSELKEKLDRLGPVNLVAIDEHKELEERFKFLTHQQEDLATAKDTLLKAIQKINKTTKELFIETFQKIQIEFKAFFKQLFGGGQAELVLIDEQDVLESGIEIIVRPPGKKIQNIMLLSGGEKALTAIALLFSIFKVKPSPFCVLDELDAPLDESNVIRFSNALKDFLKMSQFIIITHNKRTIELADVMYGITMQERGVSRVVSVKFIDHSKKDGANDSKSPKTDEEIREESKRQKMIAEELESIEEMQSEKAQTEDLTGAASHP